MSWWILVREWIQLNLNLSQHMDNHLWANNFSWFSLLFAANTIQFCISTVMDSADNLLNVPSAGNSASGHLTAWFDQETRDLVKFFYEHRHEWTGSGWKKPMITACINYLHSRHPNVIRTANAVTKKFCNVSILFTIFYYNLTDLSLLFSWRIPLMLFMV